MKRLAFFAALIAGPAIAGTDAEISVVNDLFLETPCSKLVQIVVENDPRTQSDRQLRTAAYGFIVGRALNSGLLGAAMLDHIKDDVARLAEGCAGQPDRTWQSVMRAW